MSAKLTPTMINVLRYLAASGTARDEFLLLLPANATNTCAALVTRGLITPATTLWGHKVTDDGRKALATLARDAAPVVTVTPIEATPAETIELLEQVAAEPQYVTVTDEQGVIWHLTDADGQPVEAGEYTAKDGDRFTIAEHPEAYFGLSVNEAPRTVDITWQTIAGKPRSKRQSGVFGAYVDMIVDGWRWERVAA